MKSAKMNLLPGPGLIDWSYHWNQTKVVRSLSLRIVTELTKVPNFAQLELTAIL